MDSRVRRGITFLKTIIPTDFSSTLQQLPAELNRMGLPDTLLGTDWGTVAKRCADILAAAVDATNRLLVRAPTLNRSTTRLSNEYDAQNLFFLALRPWIPDLELNPFQIRYAGQDKSADLAGVGSRLVIEVKYVSNADSAAAVVKQLAGLSEIYSGTARTKAIIFAIIVADFERWDSVKVGHDFTSLTTVPVVLTRSIIITKLQGPQPDFSSGEVLSCRDGGAWCGTDPERRRSSPRPARPEPLSASEHAGDARRPG